MKKYALTAILLFGLILSANQAFACDKGCTMGGSYLGILPQFHKHFVGIRFNTRQYTYTQTHTHLHEGMPHEHQEVTNEQYNSYEIWGRFYPTKRLQAFVFVPYVQNTQITGNTTVAQHGLGDITVQANYAVFDQATSEKIKHTLLLGGGVKLPTGAYKSQHSEVAGEPSLQPGTGSIDMLVNGMYTIRYDKIGVSSDFTYRFNSAAQDGYRFGNRFYGSANLFYWQNIGQVAVLPSAGAYFEKASPDSFHSAEFTQNGGGAFFGNIGLNIYYKKIALGGSLQKPISYHQHAEHLTKNNNRASVNISFMF